MAIGSFGLRPGPSVRRNEIWLSFNGESQDVSGKRSACQASAGFPSTLEMHSLIDMGLCGGAIESAGIRPMDGS